MILTEQQHQQIHVYLLVLFAFWLLPFPRISVLALVGIGLNGLAGGYPWRYPRLAFGRWPLLIIAFYGLHLLGLSYTENMPEAWFDLETKLSYLLLPPIFFAIPLQQEARRTILRSFILGCLVATLYAYGAAIVFYWQTGLNSFYYKYLSEHINAHPTYIAIYLNLVLFLLLEEWSRNRDGLTWQALAGRSVLFLYFVVFMVLLTARMQLLLLLFLLSISFLSYMLSQRKMGLAVLGLIGGVLLVATLTWMIPTTQKRIKEAYQEINDPKATGNVRWAVWGASMELIGEAPLLGHGTGDVQDQLDRLYERDGIKKALDSHFNAHNQYLQTTLALGLVGLLLLLLNVLPPLWLALRQKKYIAAFYSALLLLSMLTECILEVQMGILFFIVFHCFFLVDLEKA